MSPSCRRSIANALPTDLTSVIRRWSAQDSKAPRVVTAEPLTLRLRFCGWSGLWLSPRPGPGLRATSGPLLDVVGGPAFKLGPGLLESVGQVAWASACWSWRGSKSNPPRTALLSRPVGERSGGHRIRGDSTNPLDGPQLKCEHLDGVKLSKVTMTTNGFAVEVSVTTMSTKDRRVALRHPSVNVPGGQR